jgi:zinc D-Ala-D-Ala carboxypeptidase
MTNEESYIWFANPDAVPFPEWNKRWPDFTPDEVCCKGTKQIFIQIEAMDKLQKMRNIIMLPLKINSAYRTPAYNKEIGGSINSQHIFGRAFDVKIRGGKWGVEEMKKAARMVGFTGVGLYDTFIHVDNRPSGQADWDMRGKNGQD